MPKYTTELVPTMPLPHAPAPAPAPAADAATGERVAALEAERAGRFWGGCPGIKIALGSWSGCNAADTGATDCPTCGPRSAARAQPQEADHAQ